MSLFKSGPGRNYMFTHSKLAKSVRLATAFGAASVMLNASIAHAEEAGEKAEEAERITVVGSRIRTDEFANDTPIDIITVADGEAKGFKSLGELLRTSTAASGSSQITAAMTTGFVTDGGTGAETVSLRGLGANRTLVLLNGRRAGPAGTRGAVSSFDLNSLPLSAIERVEILKDGASALYGSDAVAGVINIITKKGDDKTITVDVSQPFDSGGEERRINISYGEEFDKGSFRVTADYLNKERLNRGDRDYLNCTERLQFAEDGSRTDPIDPRTGDYHCSEAGYGLWLAGGVSSAYGGSLQAAYDYDGFFAANGYDSINDNADVNFSTPDGWYPVSYGNDYASEGLWDLQHPFLDKETLSPETTLTSLYVTGDYNLTDDILVYGEFIHSNRVTESDNYRQFWTADVGFLSADSFDGFSGDGFILPVALTDHFASEIDVDYTRGVIGATGDIGFWTWDVSYQHSHNTGKYTQEIIFNDSMLMAQNHVANGTTCNGETTEFSNKTCVDIPWTDPNFLAGNHNAEQSDFLFGEETGKTTYKQQTLEAYITGDLFTLPAGEVGTAIGIQIQRDEINDTPGEHTLNGNSWGLSGAGVTAGRQLTKAIYGEFLVPVLEDLPGVEKLDLTASARWTDVDTYGSDTTYKLGLNWTIAEGFNIRASRGSSFRSPALFELYLAEQTGFGGQLTIDPCLDYVAEFNAGNITQTRFNNCQAHVPAEYTIGGSSALLVTSGGEGRLEAETSVAEGIGFVFTSPENTYAFSIDYYKFEIEGEIRNLGGDDVTFGCYDSNDFANEPLCALFTRRDGSDNNDYGIDVVNGGYVNIANQVARGVDYQFTYDEDFDFGSLRFVVEHNMQIERVSQLFEDSPYNNFIGENGDPKHTGTVRLSYTNDDFNITWTANYYDSTNDYEYAASETNTTTLNGETVTFVDETPWTTYHTVSAGFDYESFDFIVGIANVFDKEPPKISASGFELGNAARHSQYDFVGRRAFANIRYNF